MGECLIHKNNGAEGTVWLRPDVRKASCDTAQMRRERKKMTKGSEEATLGILQGLRRAIRPHLGYLAYVVRHKWFVFLECQKLGVSLRQGIPHDLDKFLPDEWFPYVASFYGPQPRTQAVKDAFAVAWLHHWHRNPHHWEHWLSYSRSGPTALPMPDRYRREMLADWRGAGRAQGKGSDTVAFFRANGPTMLLHPETRQWIEAQLGIGMEGA